MEAKMQHTASKQTTIFSLSIVAAALALASCTIGETDQTVGKPVELPGVNRPFRNGCTPDLTVEQCAAAKGVHPQIVCPFQQRVPNAMFVILDLANIWMAGDQAEFFRVWQYENLVLELPPEENTTNLSDACSHASFWGAIDASWYPVTVTPTEVGCSELGGYWDGKYCY